MEVTRTITSLATAHAVEKSGECDNTTLPAETTALSLVASLRRLWSHFDPKRCWQLSALLAVMIASGLAEVVSLAAVVPFLTVLADPSRAWRLPGIHHWAFQMGYTEPCEMLFPLTIVFVVAAISSALLRLANLWLSGRIGAAVGSDIAHEAYRRTLYQPYSIHTARNSSTVIAGVITHVNRLIHHIIYAGLQFVSCTIAAIAIAICLVVIDPTIALLSLAVFGSAYTAMGLLTKNRLLTLSFTQAQCNQALIQTVQEGLGGIRDVLLDQSQPFYLAKYDRSDSLLRRSEAESEFISGFPRFVIEGLGTAAIALLAYILASRPGGIATALPVLGACALGAQRLLPVIQQGYFSFSQLRSGTADLQAVVALLDQPPPPTESAPVKPLPFKHQITLQNISFRYPGQKNASPPWILRRIDLTIDKGERVAIVGPTGSGKSTLVDLLMGLLEPTEGRILVDGSSPDHASWRACIAHVPQSIFLADASIAENIALGIPLAQIDQLRLRQSATQAQIADYIDSLPEGYMSRIGERGVRLSGGQRQRIGIARALYKNTSLIVLDEATNALDQHTEQSFTQTLEQLSRDLTIVMVTHRLSSTRFCTRAIRVDAGSVQEISLPQQSANNAIAP